MWCTSLFFVILTVLTNQIEQTRNQVIVTKDAEALERGRIFLKTSKLLCVADCLRLLELKVSRRFDCLYNETLGKILQNPATRVTERNDDIAVFGTRTTSSSTRNYDGGSATNDDPGSQNDDHGRFSIILSDESDDSGKTSKQELANEWPMSESVISTTSEASISKKTGGSNISTNSNGIPKALRVASLGIPKVHPGPSELPAPTSDLQTWTTSTTTWNDDQGGGGGFAYYS